MQTGSTTDAAVECSPNGHPPEDEYREQHATASGEAAHSVENEAHDEREAAEVLR